MKLYRQLAQKKSVAVCIPCRDTLHSEFSYCLAMMMKQSQFLSYDFDLLQLQGSLISAQRQKLAETAILRGNSHILWLDSDMIFPVDIVDRLSSHNLPIVACTYSTRTAPYKGVAYRTIGDWNSWISLDTDQVLVNAEGVGMGCMLLDVKIFDNMTRPWFEVTYNESLHEHLGEDFYFCSQARKLGFPIMIDIASSKLLRHLGTTGFDLCTSR